MEQHVYECPRCSLSNIHCVCDSKNSMNYQGKSSSGFGSAVSSVPPQVCSTIFVLLTSFPTKKFLTLINQKLGKVEKRMSFKL